MDFNFWFNYFERLGLGEVFVRTIMIALACIWIEYFSKIRQWNKNPKAVKSIVNNKAAEHGLWSHIILGSIMTALFSYDRLTKEWLHFFDTLTLFFMYAILSGPIHMLLRGIVNRYNKYNNGGYK